jgi:hypothetical protein
MKGRLLFAVTAALSVSLTSCVSTGVPPGAVLLGDRMVAFRGDRDVVEVGGAEGRFRSLLIAVEKNDIEMFDIVVVYSNGQRESFNTRLLFHEGSRSRQLPLRGEARRIRSVLFHYRTVGTWAGGRAQVLLYGIPAEAPQTTGARY